MNKMIKVTTIVFALLLTLASFSVTATAQQQQRLSDDMIETLVKHRLMRAGLWQGNNIKIDADDGVVELEGKVLSPAQKRRAEQIAWRVDDVMRVENKLEVEARFRNDQEVANEISKDIRSHVYFDVFDWVEGKVNNGVVTLTGAVREPWRKQEYGNIAEDVLGVREVNNQIKVLPTSIYDDQLRLATARLIYNDPRFARYANRANPPIHIIVDNGRITLEGAVNSQVEKQLIGALVRSGTLSFDVTNNLSVDTEQQAQREQE
jgi:hyperosmotically inducible periplasmic protein